ncbi:hypothetical protein K9N68_23665 [Kovacikia minuta CCNUW1]|uniref:hypothetical protein n=1 Tax=Kovacikia minuta TaxID=2931930 RepID=UPI001CCE428D|nr:hypothetical protein [Kovacikia minuta]UBF24649.1 hypothetical protein K9N68_23665 [Kovacikia minuta CCNUW1]
MKLNSTVALTLILLALMVGAGLVSAAWGIALGRDALKGVTQPDTRPTNNLAKRQGTTTRHEEFTILREEDIVASAKSRINGTAKASAPAVNKLASNSGSSKTKFPMVSQSENIVLEVNSAQKQGDSLVLRVNLRNDGDQPVKFDATSLNVADDNGQTVDNKVSGLPSELPSASGTVSSTVTIPIAALKQTENISLNLKDQDEQIELDVPDIPVPR